MQAKVTRIIFEYKNRFYKYLNFFLDKKDNSFYFHLYEAKGNKIKSPKIPLENRLDNKICFDDFICTDFERNKISFHKSGYIHSTDNKGIRFRDGIVGIPFDYIEKSLLVLVLGPPEIESLIEFQKINNETDIIIKLPSDIKPFTVNFEIFRKTKQAELDIPSNNIILDGYFMVEYDEKTFGLRVYLQDVLGEAIWPPFNLILTRRG